MITMELGNILFQLFKKTAANRHSALDAESSVPKFLYVTVFEAAGCRVGARHDYILFVLFMWLIDYVQYCAYVF